MDKWRTDNPEKGLAAYAEISDVLETRELESESSGIKAAFDRAILELGHSNYIYM